MPPHCLYFVFEACSLSLSVRAHACPSLWPAQKPAQTPAVCDLRIAPLLSAHVPVPPAQGTQIGLVPVPYMDLASSITRIYSSVAAPCPLAAPLPDSLLTLVNLPLTKILLCDQSQPFTADYITSMSGLTYLTSMK